MSEQAMRVLSEMRIALESRIGEQYETDSCTVWAGKSRKMT
jgi:hypothetical protein